MYKIMLFQINKIIFLIVELTVSGGVKNVDKQNKGNSICQAMNDQLVKP